MATQRASLARGTTILDYANPTRILKAFDGDMKAIRAEYSRIRSIERKRIDRMREAGEVYNKFYSRYSDPEALPTTRSLTDKEVLEYLSDAAHGIAGGYKSSLSEIREARKDTLEALQAEAAENGDYELVEMLSKNPTAKQMADVGKMMGMIQKTVGKLEDSNKVYQAALKAVLGKSKESLLSKTARVMMELGFDEDEEGNETGSLERLKSTYTSKGNYRVSYQKSRGKRGM